MSDYRKYYSYAIIAAACLGIGVVSSILFRPTTNQSGGEYYDSQTETDYFSTSRYGENMSWIKIREWDTPAEWETEVIEEVSMWAHKETSIALDSDNNPYILYFNWLGYEEYEDTYGDRRVRGEFMNVMCAHKYDDQWIKETVDDLTFTAYNTPMYTYYPVAWCGDIALDSNDIPHVIFIVGDHFDPFKMTKLKYAVFSGETWASDYLWSANEYRVPTIAVDQNDDVYVTYHALMPGTVIYGAKAPSENPWDLSLWNQIDIVNDRRSVDIPWYYSEIVLDKNGKMNYIQSENFETSDVILNYYTEDMNTESRTVETVDTNSNEYIYGGLDMALGPDGDPYFTWDNPIGLVWWNGTGYEKELLDISGKSDIKVDYKDRPHILILNQTGTIPDDKLLLYMATRYEGGLNYEPKWKYDEILIRERSAAGDFVISQWSFELDNHGFAHVTYFVDNILYYVRELPPSLKMNVYTNEEVFSSGDQIKFGLNITNPFTKLIPTELHFKMRKPDGDIIDMGKNAILNLTVRGMNIYSNPNIKNREIGSKVQKGVWTYIVQMRNRDTNVLLLHEKVSYEIT